MKGLLGLVASLTLVVFLAAGCQSSPSAAGRTSSTPAATASVTATALATTCPAHASGFAKTKFAGHAALGFGAVHRYIYKPYRAGTFRSGAPGRLTAFVKAGLAALFIKREVRLAAAAAQNSPALCRAILAPLRTVSETVQDAVAKLKGGDTAGISAVESSISRAKSAAASHGTTIVENPNAPLG